MTTTVADVVADGLARAGALRAFACGDSPLLAALDRRGFDILRAADPGAACVMAAISGALDGAPGVVIVGDTLAAAVTGIGHAFARRWPVVVVGTGGLARGSGPPGPGLEAITKATLVLGAESAAHWIAHGCRLAMTEPWGPVHLHVASGVAGAPALPVATRCRPDPLPAADPVALDDAARRLGAAERPVVVAGRLCRSEADAAWLRAFAEARPAPVLVTPAARGVLPDPHPLVIGTLGGGDAERTLLESADLVVAVGLDSPEARGHAWPTGIGFLHLTPASPDPIRGEGDAAVAGDIGLILEELAPRLRDARLAEWDVARLHALKQAAAAPPAHADELAAFQTVELARRLTPDGAIAVFESGRASVVSRAWPATAPGECFVSSGTAEAFTLPMGVAVPLARPGRRVVCFTEASVPSSSGSWLEGASAPGPLATVAAMTGDFVVSFERALAGPAGSPIHVRLAHASAK